MRRPVVTYSLETWTLVTKDENNLRIFERQILRKISGSVNIDNVWRIRNPLAYTDVPETAGLARSINTQPAVRRNSETNTTSQHNRGMY